MPFRSEAQRKKFKDLLAEGKITQAKYDEWEKATGKTKLPDRVHRNSKDYDSKFDEADKRLKARFGVK